MTTPPHRIGIDLGGTKIEARVLTANGAEAITPIRVATPREDYDGTVQAIRDLIEQAEQAVGGKHLPSAMAIPGGICPVRDVVKNANSTWLNGRALHRDLETALGRAVRLENDANCFALSEAKDGAAKGAASVFGVILGTGVGGGIVIDGKVHSGANRVGGEWGHNQIPPIAGPDGRACYCGKTDCVETHLSGPALEATYLKAAGHAMRASEIAASENPIAQSVYADWIGKLAASLGTLVNVLDPDVIVLGGGLSNIAGLSEELNGRLPAHVFGTSGAPLATRIITNLHGDSSGARGAAWLAGEMS